MCVWSAGIDGHMDAGIEGHRCVYLYPCIHIDLPTPPNSGARATDIQLGKAADALRQASAK